MVHNNLQHLDPALKLVAPARAAPPSQSLRARIRDVQVSLLLARGGLMEFYA